MGDLKDRASLDAACNGVDAIISTASSSFSRQAGDSIQSVDLEGQLSLIEAARASGVRHFVFVSFPNVAVAFPLQDAKRAVEKALMASGMSYTILQPTFFMEVWLSPAVGFDAANAKAQIFGSGKAPISWISFQDVATFAVASLSAPLARNTVIKLGGPDALTPLQVVETFEKISGRHFSIEFVPKDALQAKWSAANDPIEKSFAGLMLYYTLGDVIDMTSALRWCPTDLVPVRQLAAQTCTELAGAPG
jgi:uncharacterized protein YbjT (DUF2867 family)